MDDAQLLNVSVDDLVWAAAEVTNLLKSASRNDALVADRVHFLIHSSRSMWRALVEDKIVTPLKGRVGAAADPSAPAEAVAAWKPPRELPTAADLQRAGLTLEAIVAKDPTLSGKALIYAGIVRSHAHLIALGVNKFSDLVRLVGPPRDIRRWMRAATGTDQAWRVDFLAPIAFKFDAWLGSRQLLLPEDLAALEFWLGAHLEVNPGHWPLVARDAPAWLTTAPREQWIESRQLTAAQYDQLAGNAPASAPPTSKLLGGKRH
jgi:hypothetical protein